MANQLKMATIQAILLLRARRWSFRRIARELGVHRETVGRYVRAAESNPTKALLGSNDSGGVVPNPPGRSACEPWREPILAKLTAGLSAQRIYQDLTTGADFGGRYHSVKRFMRKLRGTTPLPFRRMECQPGEEAQVAFGKGAPIVTADGKRGYAQDNGLKGRQFVSLQEQDRHLIHWETRSIPKYAKHRAKASRLEYDQMIDSWLATVELTGIGAARVGVVGGQIGGHEFLRFPATARRSPI